MSKKLFYKEELRKIINRKEALRKTRKVAQRTGNHLCVTLRKTSRPLRLKKNYNINKFIFNTKRPWKSRMKPQHNMV